jgi:predicted branched-subunit amino acid permease
MMPKESSAKTSLTSAGVGRGVRLGLPLAGSGFIYGLAFATLALQIGLSPVEALLMSALVFSGTAQIAIVQIWATLPGPLAAALIVMIANVRYVLMSASLRPWLAPLPSYKAMLTLSVLVDSAYAIGMRHRADGDGDVGVMFGASLASYFGWVTGTGLGYLLGRMISDPRAIGLDFVVIAFCAAAAMQMSKNLRDYWPAVAAVAAVLVVERIAPGPWAVIAAGLTAAAVAAYRYRPDTSAS